MPYTPATNAQSALFVEILSVNPSEQQKLAEALGYDPDDLLALAESSAASPFRKLSKGGGVVPPPPTMPSSKKDKMGTFPAEYNFAPEAGLGFNENLLALVYAHWTDVKFTGGKDAVRSDMKEAMGVLSEM